jgi:hypothetical protein
MLLPPPANVHQNINESLDSLNKKKNTLVSSKFPPDDNESDPDLLKTNGINVTEGNDKNKLKVNDLKVNDKKIINVDLVKSKNVKDISANNEDIKLDNDILISDFQYSHSKNLGKSIYYYCKMIFDICQTYFRMSKIKFWFEYNSEENSYTLVSIKTDSYYNDNKLMSIILDNFDFDLTNFYERISLIDNLDTYTWTLEKENLMLEVI